MYFIGIDWADEKHDICIIDQKGTAIQQFEITNNQRGFDILRKRLVRLNDSVRLNIERSDGLLVNWLVRNAYDVYLTPPLSLHHSKQEALVILL